MAVFHLRIVSGNRVFYDGRAQIVVVPELDGECAFMAHHENMVVAVQPGEIRFRKEDGSWQYAVAGTGFAEAANNRVTILLDTVERPEEIDEARAQAALERAQEELRQKRSIQEYRISQAALARAVSRIRERQKRTMNL